MSRILLLAALFSTGALLSGNFCFSQETAAPAQSKEEGKTDDSDFEIINPLKQGPPKKQASEKAAKETGAEKKSPQKHQLAALKKTSSELRKIIDIYDSMNPEDISINAKMAAQAAELKNIIGNLSGQVEEKKQELTDQKRAYKRAGEEMRAPRKNEEAVAWYYISDRNNSRHSMKEKPSASRGPVKYVLPPDDRGEKERKILKPDVERLEKEYKELAEKYSSYKERYQKIKKDYKAYLEKKNGYILKQIKETEEKSAPAASGETHSL